jgi:signal peptidase I
MEKQNRTRNKLISGLATFFLIMSICLCLFVFVQVINKGYVAFGGYSFFRVATGSMEPSIPVGSLILTQEKEIETIEIDDVVSFYSKESYMNGSIITHRVVDKNEGLDGSILLTTRGDANSTADIHYVDSENLIGKVIWTSESGNFFAKLIAFFSSKMGFFTCIALPAMLISVFIFKKCMKTIMLDMKRLKAQMNEEKIDIDSDSNSTSVIDISANAADSDQNAQEIKQQDSAKNSIDPHEYDEMYDRIRAELIEEVKRTDDREQSKK